MMTDAELLRRYVEDHAEEAFTELVHRQLGLVYSTALRRVGHDAQLAEDVAQKIFTDLARKAPSLLRRASLGGRVRRRGASRATAQKIAGTAHLQAATIGAGETIEE